MDIVLGIASLVGRLVQGLAAFLLIAVTQIVTGIAFALALAISAGPLILSVILVATLLLVPAIEFNTLSAGIAPIFEDVQVTQNNIIDTLNTIIGIGESFKRVYNKGALFIMGILHGISTIAGLDLFEYADQLRRMNMGLDAVEMSRHRNIIVEGLTRDNIHKLKHMSTEDRNLFLDRVEMSVDAYVGLMTSKSKGSATGRIEVDTTLLTTLALVVQIISNFIVAIITLVSIPTFAILNAFLSVVIIDPSDGSVTIKTSLVVEFVILIIEAILEEMPFSGCFLPIDDLPRRVIGCTCSWRYDQDVYNPIFSIGSLTKIPVPSNLLIAMVGCVCFTDDVDLASETNVVTTLRKCFGIDKIVEKFTSKITEVGGTIASFFVGLYNDIVGIFNDAVEFGKDVVEALDRVTGFCDAVGCRDVDGQFDIPPGMRQQILEDHGTLAYHAVDMLSFIDPETVKRARNSAATAVRSMKEVMEGLDVEIETKLHDLLGLSDIFTNTTAVREYMDCVRNHTAAANGDCNHPMSNMVSPQMREMGITDLHFIPPDQNKPIIDFESMDPVDRNAAARSLLMDEATRNLDMITEGIKDGLNPSIEGSYANKKVRSIERIASWDIMRNATDEINHIYGEKGGVAFKSLLKMVSGIAEWSRWILSVDMNSNEVSMFDASERLVQMGQFREGYLRSMEFMEDLEERKMMHLIPGPAMRLRRGMAVLRAQLVDEDHIASTLADVAQFPHDEEAAKELGNDLSFVRSIVKTIGESPLVPKSIRTRHGTASAVVFDDRVSEHIMRSASNMKKLAENAEEESVRIDAKTDAMLAAYRMSHHRAAARQQRTDRGHPFTEPFGERSETEEDFVMDEEGRVVGDPDHIEPRATYDFKFILTSSVFTFSIGVGGALLTVAAGIVAPLLALLVAALLFVVQLAAVIAQGIFEKIADTDSVVFNFFDRIFDAFRLVGFDAFNFGLTPAIITTLLDAVEKQIEENIEYAVTYAVYKATCNFPVGIGEQKCGPLPKKDVAFFDYLFYGLIKCNYNAPCLSTKENLMNQRCFCSVDPLDPLSAQREGTPENRCFDFNTNTITGRTHCFPFFLENTYINRVDYEWNVQPSCPTYEITGLPFWRRDGIGFFTIVLDFLRDIFIDSYRVINYAWRRFLGTTSFGSEGLFAGVGSFLLVIPGFILSAVSLVTAGQMTVKEIVVSNIAGTQNFFAAFVDVPVIGRFIGTLGDTIKTDFFTPTAGTANDDACAIRFSPTVIWGFSVGSILGFVALGTVIPTVLILSILLLVELFAVLGIVFGRSIALYLTSVKLSRARMIEPRYDIGWAKRMRGNVVNGYNRMRSSKFMPLPAHNPVVPSTVLPTSTRIQYAPLVGLKRPSHPESVQARKQLVATSVRSVNTGTDATDHIHAVTRVHVHHSRPGHESWVYLGMSPYAFVRYQRVDKRNRGMNSRGEMSWMQASMAGFVHWINAIPHMLSWQFVNEAIQTRPLRGLYMNNPAARRLAADLGFHSAPQEAVQRLFQLQTPYVMGVARYDSQTPLGIGPGSFQYARYLEDENGTILADSDVVDVFDRGYYTTGSIDGHRGGLTLYTSEDQPVIFKKHTE